MIPPDQPPPVRKAPHQQPTSTRSLAPLRGLGKAKGGRAFADKLLAPLVQHTAPEVGKAAVVPVPAAVAAAEASV